MSRKLNTEWQPVGLYDIERRDGLVGFHPLVAVGIFDMDLLLDERLYQKCRARWYPQSSKHADTPWYLHEAGKGDLHWISEEDLLRSQVRYRASKKMDAHNRYADEVEVGDFVRCSGSRDKLSWRKIVAVHDFVIMGTKYREPFDVPEFATGNGSTNFIHTIVEHRKASDCIV